jgi:hypothetical protein
LGIAMMESIANLIRKTALNQVRGVLFPVPNIIVGGKSLPEYNMCGLKCKHLSSAQDDCYLFRSKIKDLKRGKLCLAYTEGLT